MFFEVVVDVFFMATTEKRFDASDVLLWVFIFHDATLKPCQKACAHLSMTLCLHQKLLESR